MFAASKSGGVVAGTSGDPYWTSVSLLTNFENSLTFQNGSTNNFAITRTGVVNPSLNTPFTGGVGGSEYFNGSTGYLSVPNSAPLQLTNTGAFTLECWIYPTTISVARYIFTNYNQSPAYSGYGFGIGCDNFNTQLQFWDGVLWRYFGAITANVWTHIAITYQGSGTTGLVFVNGVQQGSAFPITSVINYTAGNALIGAQSASAGFFAGYISNFRIVKGTAVYTANFTPPTAPLTAITNTSLLITGTGQGMFNNSTFVDQGPNALTVTATGAPVYSGLSPFGNTYAGSVKFDGTSQYVTAPDNAALNMGAADFTLEAWIYLTTTPGASTNDGANVINKDGKVAVSWAQYNLFVNSALKVCASFSSVPNGGGAPTAVITGSTTLALNTWYHVAVTRIGVNGTVWVNGSSNGTTTSIPATLANGARALHIGYEESQAAFAYFPGYISNARIVKGTAVYTANFTPSTTPLTAITNTSLLVRGDTGAFYDLSNNGNGMTSTGTTEVTTQFKKFGSESGTYASTGRQSVTNAANLQFGSGDYTIEAWVYRPSATLLRTLLSKGGAATGWLLQINTSQQVIFTVTSTIILTSTATISTGTWTHIAVTRSGTTTRLFVAGNLEATATDSTAFSQTENLSIGVDRSNTSGLNGYLDDIRLTKGVARYTATFTPPTVTFPTA